jgi:hypothetical protein
MTWRKILPPLAFTTLGLGAGIILAPHLRGGGDDPTPGQRTARAVDVAVERSPADRAAKVDGQAAARRLLAMARAAQQASAVAPRGDGSRSGGPGPVEFDQLPAPVKAAVSRLAAGQPVKPGWAQRLVSADNRTLYRVKADIAGVEHHLSIDEQGGLQQTKVDLGAAEIPAQVHRVVGAAWPGAVLLKAARLTETGRPPYYEVDVRAGSERRELQIDEAGAVLRDRLH